MPKTTHFHLFVENSGKLSLNQQKSLGQGVFCVVLQSKTNGWELNHPPPLSGIVSFRGCTLPETNIDLKNCWLEDEILFGMAYFFRIFSC